MIRSVQFIDHPLILKLSLKENSNSDPIYFSNRSEAILDLTMNLPFDLCLITNHVRDRDVLLVAKLKARTGWTCHSKFLYSYPKDRYFFTFNRLAHTEESKKCSPDFIKMESDQRSGPPIHILTQAFLTPE
ncbi:hypothetical protein ACJX0J_040021, partial [Zea mays]